VNRQVHLLTEVVSGDAVVMVTVVVDSSAVVGPTDETNRKSQVV